MVIAFMAAHLLYYALFPVLYAGRVEAGISARCQSGWDWARNSLNQDPCEVLALLESECRGISVILPGLHPPDTVSYAPPNSKFYSTLQCDCNVPSFNIVQACIECQGGNITTWGLWTKGCLIVTSGLPFAVPQGSTIPRWAFTGNVESNFVFLATLAMSVGRDPEATPATVGPPTAVISGSSILNSSPPTTVSPIFVSSSGGHGPTVTLSNGNSNKKSNTVHKIIIGVPSGIGAILFLVAGAWFFLSRRKRRKREEAVAREMIPLPASQVPGPSAYTRKRTSRWSPEPSYSGFGSRRLFVTNPSESPTSSISTPPVSRVFSNLGDTDKHPGRRFDDGQV